MEAGNPVGRLVRLSEYLVEKLDNLGVLVAIDVPGRPRLYIEAGHRSLDRQSAITRNDLYQIGSQTKMMTALAVLLLAREGAVRLDDAVVTHLPLNIDRRICIRHLLQHTSGLGEFTDVMMGPHFDPQVIYEPNELVALARTQGQIFEPGNRFDYCNTGWVIAAMLIESITGRRYADVLTERVLQPLGMTDSYVGAGGAVPVEKMACGYLKTRTGTAPLDSARLPMSWAIGSGDVVSGCDDMLTFARALLSGDSAIGLTLDDLARDIVRPTRSPKFAMSIGTEYGYGLQGMQWAGPLVWGHRGGTFGYNTSTWVDPVEGIAVVTCVTRILDLTEGELASLRYPGPQLFALALATAYSLNEER